MMKRAELRRTTTFHTEVRPKQCAAPGCVKEFFPRSTLDSCCPRCTAKIRKLNRDAKKAERAQDRAKREAMKGLRELLAEAQQPFNEYVRLRDADKPCVSCGTESPPMRPGGQWDCGHFLSRGARPELRFTEDNAAKQCKACNAGGGRFKALEATITQRFEAELRRRIGDERVDWLKGPHAPHKWTREELRGIRDTYRARVAALKRERNQT